VLEVVANLAAKSDPSLGLVFRRLGFLAFHLFQPRHLRAKHLPGLRPVLVLTPLLLTLDDDSSREVSQPDSRVGLVNMLTAGPAGPVGIGPHIGFIDFNRLGILDFGSDVNGRKTGLAFSFGIERADPDQPVHAGFPFEIAIGHGAADRQRG